MHNFLAHLARVRRSRRDLAVAAFLFGVITLARVVIPGSVTGVAFLYVVPVALLAVNLGLRGGVVAAGVATGCASLWLWFHDDVQGLVGAPLRLIVFGWVAALVGILSEQVRDRELLVSQLRHVASHDQLTGLPNRRAWDERFAHELQRATRSGEPLTVVAIDLDHLKQVNDTDGHAAGDGFIAESAAAWRRALRTTDFVARLGGDEFSAVLPNCTEAYASKVAERASQTSSRDHRFSVGIARWDGEESGPQLLARADQALYDAKRAAGAVPAASS